MQQAIAYSREMQEISVARNPSLSLPNLDFAGTPCGIDIRKVVDNGIRPVLTTGIAHCEAGVGQIGAGIVRTPMACYGKAVLALAERLGALRAVKTPTAPRGMVTAPHHSAAQSGVAVLRDGGNAVEAMVAAAATIAVVYPHMNGIGGDGFWLVSRPGAAPVGIDACGRAAERRRRSFIGSAAGDPHARTACGEYRGRRRVRLGGRARHRARPVAARAAAGGRDLVCARGRAGHAQPS